MLSKNEDIAIFIMMTTGLILLLIGFIILILFLYKRKQLNFYKSLEVLKDDYEKSLLSVQLEIQEQTLKHISLEIHDNIGHALSVTKLCLNTIQWNDPADVSNKVAGSLNQLNKAIADLNSLSKTMNYDYIKDHGILAALELEIEQVKRLNLYAVTLDIAGTHKPLPAEKEVLIFRIVQEALNNSMKHASPTELVVYLQYTDSHLHIEVRDNGKGGVGIPGGHTNTNGSGLKNMQHRSRQLNGICHITDNHPAGTAVRVSIPVKTYN